MRTRPTHAVLATLSTAALLATTLAAPALAEDPGDLTVPEEQISDDEQAKGTDTFVVVLADDPVATYDGDVRGLAATRDVDPDSARARAYERFLERQADRALRRSGIGVGAKDEQFTQALSGFTAELSEAQAEQLRSDRRVLTVAPNEIRQLTTDSTPDFLGLTDAEGGLWADRGLLGEDVVIGVIDSGIRPDSQSFADDGSYGPLSDWDGTCQTGEDDSFDCDPENDKLIGARYYVDGFGGAAQTIADFPEEFLSPLDADGHGTHTASTAGGNADVTTPFGDIAGMAPRARVAAYKVCWGYSGNGGCATADSVKAIDDAVADGVDVINYSISGTTSNYVDPVELAFLFAADAGVVVNASAGNDGPAVSTVNHPSPWITTVAAGTEELQFAGSVTVGGELPTECASLPIDWRLNRRASEYEATASGIVDGKVTVTITRTAEGEEQIRLRRGRTPSMPATVRLDQGETVEMTVRARNGHWLRVQERTRGGWVNVARFQATDCVATGPASFQEYDVEPGCVDDGTVSIDVTRTAEGPETVRLRSGAVNGRGVELTTGETVALTIVAANGSPVRLQEFKSGRWQTQGTIVVVDCESGGGDGEQTFPGAPSIGNPGTSVLPLVYAGDAPAEGAVVADAALCLEGSLDPTVVAGTMVLCDRGAIARTGKSDTVAAAGGVAMILGNTSPNSLNSDAHVVPTTHVDENANAAIKQYIESTDTPSASQAPAEIVEAIAPDVAAFSSRGPAVGTGDVLKPDILAPGVDILAAYSPTIGGREFDYLSGTSMSSPHMAGLSALLKEAHPDWSAAAIQSAFMTTAYQTRTDGSPIADGPFAYGSGHVAPNDAVAPGLVYDADLDDYIDFLCGVGSIACGDFTFDPSDLNQPNIAIAELAGSQTVTRTVTNVSGIPISYVADVDAPDGVDVAVSPRLLNLPAGGRATFEVTFTTENDAVIGETTFGELTWKARGASDATSQLVVTPVQLAAADQVNGQGVEGSTTYEIGFGYNGDFSAAAHGLVPATRTEGTVVDDPANDINAALASGVGITLHPVTVPDGTAYTRIALFDDYTDGEDDLDLYVFGPDGAFVAGSGSGTSQEQVDVLLPAAGTYTVVVHGWQTDGPDASYTLFDWSVLADPSADDGSLVVDAPGEAVLGDTEDVTVTWSGLEEGTKYLGAVSYTDTALFGLTVVAVATD